MERRTPEHQEELIPTCPQADAFVPAQTPQQRVTQLTLRLLAASDWLKAETLADELHISRPQLTRDLARVREQLGGYALTIESRPYRGLAIAGSEKDRRCCMAALLEGALHGAPGSLLGQSAIDTAIRTIRETVLSSCRAFGYELSDLTLQNLTMHLLAAFYRIRNDSAIELDALTRERLRHEKELPLAADIVHRLEKALHTPYVPDEVFYVVQHLSSKRITHADSELRTGELVSLTDAIFERLRTDFLLDFSGDAELRTMLNNHLAPLLNRIRHGSVLKNPMLDEIRLNLPDAYDLALSAAAVINRRYNCSMSEHEISYLALHLKVAMEKARCGQKKRVLLVCSTGAGSAELLRLMLLRRFANQIETIATCGRLDLDRIRWADYDYLFTTIPLEGNFPIPVQQIKLFLDEETERRIADIMAPDSEPERYFRRELFLGHLSVPSREACIEHMIAQLESLQPMPAGFRELVFERETLSSTCLADGVALPHPARAVNEQTLICTALLDDPIDWGGSRVRLVLLLALEKGFAREHRAVMDRIVSLITDPGKQEELFRARSYEKLLDLLQ